VNALRTNTIQIRGESYVVQEMSAAVMKGARELIFDDKQKQRLEAWVAFKCCLSPKIESENAASEMPQAVISKISSEAFRLSKDEDEKQPNAPAAV